MFFVFSKIVIYNNFKIIKWIFSDDPQTKKSSAFIDETFTVIIFFLILIRDVSFWSWYPNVLLVCKLFLLSCLVHTAVFLSFLFTSFSSLLSCHSYLLLFLFFCLVILIFFFFFSFILSFGFLKNVSILSYRIPSHLFFFLIFPLAVSEGGIFAK